MNMLRQKNYPPLNIKHISYHICQDVVAHNVTHGLFDLKCHQVNIVNLFTMRYPDEKKWLNKSQI